jgi:hypothetical protein
MSCGLLKDAQDAYSGGMNATTRAKAVTLNLPAALARQPHFHAAAKMYPGSDLSVFLYV